MTTKEAPVAASETVFYCEKAFEREGDPLPRKCHTQLSVGQLEDTVICTKCGTTYNVTISAKAGKAEFTPELAHDSYGRPVELPAADDEHPPLRDDRKSEAEAAAGVESESTVRTIGDPPEFAKAVQEHKAEREKAEAERRKQESTARK